jgi:hypothetical protein
LKDCIYGKDKFKGKIFWLDNEKRQRVMEKLLKDDLKAEKFKNATEENIFNRYKDVSKYIDDKKMSKEKIQSFIMYFLERLVLVELKIEKDDTPMVFEVINDRGVALKPFEILKGKLIGALEKDDTEKYSLLWEESLERIRGMEDDFFTDYIKANFIFKRNADIEKLINNQYHRYIFETNEIGDSLKFRKKDENHNQNIKRFIEENLTYYTDLYAKIRKNENTYLSYNNDINALSGQYQNIISACEIHDKYEDEKIDTIAKEIDRLYVLLRLNGIYDSNNYQEISYELNKELKDCEIADYRGKFNNCIENRIREVRNLSEITILLDYERFKTRGYDNIDRRALRYYFARVELYICESIGKEIENEVYYISTKTAHKSGYHIEHIFSRNNQNMKYFKTEEEFESQRNRLGGLLLLYNMDNIYSNNEKYYKGKRKTYSNGMYWGRTLIDTFYHKSNSRFHDFNKKFKSETGIAFKEISVFDAKALEYRSKLLYEITKKIWPIEK